MSNLNMKRLNQAVSDFQNSKGFNPAYNDVVGLMEENDELIRLLNRALSIRRPNVKWTKAEKEREWPIWEEQVRLTLTKSAAT